MKRADPPRKVYLTSEDHGRALVDVRPHEAIVMPREAVRGQSRIVRKHPMYLWLLSLGLTKRQAVDALWRWTDFELHGNQDGVIARPKVQS